MSKDLHDNIYCSRAVSPAAATTNNTAWTSQIVDTANYECTEFVGMFGAIDDSDVTFTVLVEDGNNSALSDNAAVDDAYLLGVEAAGLRYDSDNKCWKIGYIGPKRYVRVTVTPNNNTGNAYMAGVWVQSGARVSPKSTQVV